MKTNNSAITFVLGIELLNVASEPYLVLSQANCATHLTVSSTLYKAPITVLYVTGSMGNTDTDSSKIDSDTLDRETVKTLQTAI